MYSKIVLYRQNSSFFIWEKSLFKKLDLIGLAFRCKSIDVIDELNFNETIVDPKDPNDYKLYKNKIEIDLPVIQQDRTFKK